MTTDYTPSDLFGVFQKLAKGNWQAIIVGGQAVNLWCSVERIAALMQTPDGLNAYAKGIDLWESIPFSKLSHDEAYQTFLTRRYPQLVDEIDIRRAGHARAIED